MSIRVTHLSAPLREDPNISLQIALRTRSIDGRPGTRSRDLRACPHQPKNAPSSFSPPCSRSAPECARRRRSAPNRRRQVRWRVPTCTAKSWRWTPRIRWSESLEASIIGRSDRKPSGSRHRMGRMPPRGPTARAIRRNGGVQSCGYPRWASLTTWAQLPVARSTWTELRSGKSCRSRRSVQRSHDASWPTGIPSDHSARSTSCGG